MMTEDATGWEQMANLTPRRSKREGQSVSLYLGFKTLANLQVFRDRFGIEESSYGSSRSMVAIALIEIAVGQLLDELDTAEADELRAQIEAVRIELQDAERGRVEGRE